MKQPGRERFKLIQRIYRRYFNMSMKNVKGFKIPYDLYYEFKLGAPIDYFKFRHKLTHIDFDGDREAIACSIKYNNIKTFRKYIEQIHISKSRRTIKNLKGCSWEGFMEMMHG